MLDESAPSPLAAWYSPWLIFDPRADIHPLAPVRRRLTPSAIEFGRTLELGARDSVGRVDRYVTARVEAGVSYLNLSAWGIEYEEYELALESALEGIYWLRSYAEIFPKPWGWADIRQAAAFYNAAVVFWHGDDQIDLSEEMLDHAEAWLDRVEDDESSSDSFRNAKRAVEDLRTRIGRI